MKHIIAGMFDERSQADLVVEQLVRGHGIDRSAIQVYASDTGTAGTTTSSGATSGGTTGGEGGFWSGLKELFVPEEDRSTYGEGVRRGGVVVSAEVDEMRADGVMDVFEAHGAINLDEREAEWRQSGWSGGTTVSVSATKATGAPGVATQGTGHMATHAGGEEVIPLVEESLRVGKRAQQSGRVRVRSYVVETPVTEQVTLRQEHVDVQRRAADRPVASADDAFRERTIEATETSEHAVIAKEARVTEELVIRKDVEEHVETVHETVRRQEVEIEDTRGAQHHASEANPPGTAASRAVDDALDTNISGANPQHDRR